MIHAQPQNSNILKYFFSPDHINLSTPVLMTVSTTVARNESLLNDQLALLPSNTESLVVVIDDSGASRLRKFRSLLFRQQTIKRCCQTLAKAHFLKTKMYALYPDIDNLFLVYQTDSAAATYAENYLINETPTLLNHLLCSLCKHLRLTNPSVDVVAIVGSRA